jgi:hypothetical protein
MEIDKIKKMDKKLIILTIITVILLTCDVFFAVKYLFVQQRLDEILAFNQINSKIRFFNNIFIDKVLKAQGLVSYEDRLKLENAVMDTNNKDVIDQWHRLLDSQTEAEAQQGVIDLLVLFAR